jgi:hypothetical protein
MIGKTRIPVRPIRPIRSLVICALVFLLAGVTSFATQVRRLNIEQLTAKAGRIVSGRCVGHRVSRDATLGLPVAEVTILVDRALKGAGDRRLTFRMLAGGDSLDGVPSFRVGEEVILFLYPSSAAGLTSPVGLGQGRFLIEHDKKGGSRAVNALANRGLLHNISTDTLGRLGPVAVAASRQGRPELSSDDLLDMVSRLTSARDPR